MERVGTLINKLKEQFDQQTDAASLSITAQLLLAELQFNKNPEFSKGKVSVVIPSFVMSRVEVPEIKVENPALANSLFDTPFEMPTQKHQDFPYIVIEQEQKKDVFSINDLINKNEFFELNDHLKEERVEVITKLEETPIRDLRKAISINDRHLFANSLFRGDDSMYERSIKTINSFTIYPEAQYWIQRELKVKLGWAESDDTVKHFDHLVKRRFS